MIFPHHGPVTDLICRRTGRAGKKGYAYTFVMPEQERYAGEILRALELSGSPVPPELSTMWNAYKERAKAVSDWDRFCCVLLQK